MAFTKIDAFKDQKANYPYPADNINPKLKLEKDYYLSFARAMICDWVSGACDIPYQFGDSQRSFKELYEYSVGLQSPNKIKSLLYGKNKLRNGKYITKENISYASLKVLPKFFDILREKNMRQDYDVDSMCVDDDSIQAKAADQAILKYILQADTQALLKATRFKPDLKLDPQVLGLENDADVDLFFETGGYTLEREIASVAACNTTKKLSSYKVNQDHTFDNLCRYGKAGWKFEIDKTNNTVKMRSVQMYNPNRQQTSVILPYSESNNYEHLSRGGELVDMTIKNLRDECPWLTTAQVLYIAKCYSYMNPGYDNIIQNGGYYNTATRGDMLGNYQLDPVNACKVLVLDIQWLSVDLENYIENQDRQLFRAVDYDFIQDSKSKRNGEKQTQKKIVKKYFCKWVVGTDILLDYGVAEDIIYYGPNGNKCPHLDYFFTKTGNMPLMERCIDISDDIDLANAKLRSILSSAVPSPRMVIQTGLLDNVFLNGIKQQPEDAMATFKELGYLFVNAVDDDGKPIFTNQKLVDFLPTGIQEDINVFTGQIIAGINNLREVLGIPQGADASTPNPYNGARKTELSMQSSNAALFPTFNCFQYLFESGFNHCVKMWQIIAKDRDIKLNYSPLGEKNLKALSLDGDFSNAEFNIFLTLGSTQEELTQLMSDISQMRAQGIQTNFQTGITTSEYLYLYDRIKGGNIKEAMWAMAKIEKKKIAKQQEINEQNQKQNAQDQQNSAAQAELNKQQTEIAKAKEGRKTIILQEAEKRKTAAVGAFIKDFDKEGGEAARPFFKDIMDRADAEIIGVLQQDNPGAPGQPPGQQPPQPGQPPQLPPAQPQPDMQQEPEEQVA